MKIKVLEIFEDRRYKNWYKCSIRCPYCNKKHVHGLGKFGAFFGKRKAHCGEGSYVLER